MSAHHVIDDIIVFGHYICASDITSYHQKYSLKNLLYNWIHIFLSNLFNIIWIKSLFFFVSFIFCTLKCWFSIIKMHSLIVN